MENAKRPNQMPNMCDCALNEIAVHHEFDSFVGLLKFRKQNNSKTRAHSNVYTSTHKNTITFTGKLSVLKVEPERFRIANSNFDSISLIFYSCLPSQLISYKLNHLLTFMYLRV